MPKTWRNIAPTICGSRPSEDESNIAGSSADAIAEAKEKAWETLKELRNEALVIDWQQQYTELRDAGMTGALATSDLLNHECMAVVNFGGQKCTRIPLNGRE